MVGLTVGLCVCAATVGQTVSATLGRVVRRGATVAGSPVVGLSAELAARLSTRPRVDAVTVGQAVSASLVRLHYWGLDTTAEGGGVSSCGAGVAVGGRARRSPRLDGLSVAGPATSLPSDPASAQQP